ncbi:hypothetical protein DSL64_05160 [Dyadobacter luteus]|uniref:Uncharacterized protein n=2 Tax=Dyadobacter luteus TaxID=2259619 RepID=A0A3D8YEN0_9BACT|nr:hypothetical protein DSL64_05160 [Dyadobacter luteus]
MGMPPRNLKGMRILSSYIVVRYEWLWEIITCPMSKVKGDYETFRIGNVADMLLAGDGYNEVK